LNDFSRQALVVDDDALIRGFIREILTSAGFRVEVASSALEARRIITNFDADIALLDIDLGPGVNGIDLAHIIASKNPLTTIVFLTKFPDARSAGTLESELPKNSGFVRKELVSNRDYLLEIVESAIRADKPMRHDRLPNRPLGQLTENQFEVLRLIAQGFTNNEIAKRRKTTVSAVEQIFKTITKQLDIKVTDAVNVRIEAARIYIDAVGIPDREK
jgi:DNA-binding NarL/FixJ family response regulator